jgi:hypothetical protein
VGQHLPSDKRLAVLRSAGAALLGAVAAEVVLIFAEGFHSSFQLGMLPQHLIAIAIGSLVGWTFELLRSLTAAVTTSLEHLYRYNELVESLTVSIRPQKGALRLIGACPKHEVLLALLIDASIGSRFNNIPYMGTGEYLSYLSTAIHKSDSYQGVQRNPPSWFRDRDAAYYLDALRGKRMARKCRIFIIDDVDVPQMLKDLEDAALLDYYWMHTGPVETYWISVSDFQRSCPGIAVPADFALYDEALLIAYDEDRQTLTFDVIDDSNDNYKIFQSCQQVNDHKLPALKLVPMPAKLQPWGFRN